MTGSVLVFSRVCSLPSSEWRLHYDIYRNKPDAEAVVHAHPNYCTALSANREPIPAFHYMVGAAGGKEIQCAQYVGRGGGRWGGA